MRTIALVISLAFSSIIYSQVNIIPQPAEMQCGKRHLHSLKQPVDFIYNVRCILKDHAVDFFNDYLKRFYNVTQFKEGDTHSYGFPADNIY